MIEAADLNHELTADHWAKAACTVTKPCRYCRAIIKAQGWDTPPPAPLPPTCKHCKSNFTSGGVVELCQFHRAADEMMQALEIAEELLSKMIERSPTLERLQQATGVRDSIRTAIDRARGKL